MFLMQEAPANTNIYFIAGYTVIFGTMLLYLVSLIIRRRNLKQEYELLSTEESKPSENTA